MQSTEIGINVYWKFQNSGDEKCTFIMAKSHQDACDRVRAIKGSDIIIVASQEYDRVTKKPRGDKVLYTD